MDDNLARLRAKLSALTASVNDQLSPGIELRDGRPAVDVSNVNLPELIPRVYESALYDEPVGLLARFQLKPGADFSEMNPPLPLTSVASALRVLAVETVERILGGGVPGADTSQSNARAYINSYDFAHRQLVALNEGRGTLSPSIIAVLSVPCLIASGAYQSEGVFPENVVREAESIVSADVSGAATFIKHSNALGPLMHAFICNLTWELGYGTSGKRTILSRNPTPSTNTPRVFGSIEGSLVELPPKPPIAPIIRAFDTHAGFKYSGRTTTSKGGFLIWWYSTLIDMFGLGRFFLNNINGSATMSIMRYRFGNSYASFLSALERENLDVFGDSEEMTKNTPWRVVSRAALQMNPDYLGSLHVILESLVRQMRDGDDLSAETWMTNLLRELAEMGNTETINYFYHSLPNDIRFNSIWLSRALLQKSVFVRDNPQENTRLIHNFNYVFKVLFGFNIARSPVKFRYSSKNEIGTVHTIDLVGALPLLTKDDYKAILSFLYQLESPVYPSSEWLNDRWTDSARLALSEISNTMSYHASSSVEDATRRLFEPVVAL
jgi:hypothetical protein